MDVLSSGSPEPGKPGGRVARLARALRSRALRGRPHARPVRGEAVRGEAVRGEAVRGRRVPRGVLAGAGVVVAVAVVLGLRAGAGPVVPAVPDPTPTVALAPLPTGPFDRLPGRTPIPEPSDSFGRLYGDLPPTGGGPSKAAVVKAVELVLGRFCREPDRYTISAAPQAGWDVAGAVAVGLDRGGDGALIDLVLTWTGRSYSWTGSPSQLRVC